MKRLVFVLSLLLPACAVQPPQLRDPAFAGVRPMSVVPVPATDGAIYREGFSMSLFEDLKARRIGDIITVRLAESTNASKNASTTTTKESTVDIAAPIALGRGITRNGRDIFEASVEANREFNGEGGSKQSNSLKGSIAVTVAEVLPNGNLVVRGEKVLTLNQGSEFVRFAGIVRPQDIAPDNSILSTQVADAQIIYGGTGAIADANAPGWLNRIFQSPLWPF